MEVSDPQCPILLEAIVDMNYFPQYVYRGVDFQIYRVEDFSSEECTYLSLIVPGVKFWSEEDVNQGLPYEKE